MYAKAEKAPIIYCLGVTEHSTGTEGVMSMSNLAMLVGKVGNQAVVSILCEVKIMFKVLAIWAVCLMISQAIKVNNPEVIDKFESLACAVKSKHRFNFY